MNGSHKIRWGVLGTGRITTKLIQAIHESRDGELVAVGSRSKDRAERVCREHYAPLAFGSYGELVACPEIDVIYNALPNSLHHRWSIAALKAGRHVLCEKPMGANALEAEEMFAAAASADRVLMEAFMYRHHPQIGKVRELVDAGEIGVPRLISAVFVIRVDNADNIRLQSDLAGGGLMDVGCYCLNFSRYVAAREPLSVTALAVFQEGSGVDVGLTAGLDFGQGLLATIQCGLDALRSTFAEVIGTQGRIEIPNPWFPTTDRNVLRLVQAEGEKEIEVPYQDPYLLQVENFHAAVRGDARPLVDKAETLGNMRTIDAVYAAAREGRRIALRNG